MRVCRDQRDCRWPHACGRQFVARRSSAVAPDAMRLGEAMPEALCAGGINGEPALGAMQRLLTYTIGAAGCRIHRIAPDVPDPGRGSSPR